MEHAKTKLYESFHDTLTVPCEKSKTFSFASSIMKNIVVPSARSRFPVKLICCTAFGSTSSAGCLLKSICYHLIIVLEKNYSPAKN